MEVRDDSGNDNVPMRDLIQTAAADDDDDDGVLKHPLTRSELGSVSLILKENILIGEVLEKSAYEYPVSESVVSSVALSLIHRHDVCLCCMTVACRFVYGN